jgi:hypothetical protein
MAIRKWGIQKFLNRPEHEDGGFVVAYVTPNTRNYYGFAANLTVADCDRRVHLDFAPLDIYRNTTPTKAAINSVLASIKQRREKVKAFREVVNKFCDKMEATLDDYESQVLAMEVDNDSGE